MHHISMIPVYELTGESTPGSMRGGWRTKAGGQCPRQRSNSAFLSVVTRHRHRPAGGEKSRKILRSPISLLVFAFFVTTLTRHLHPRLFPLSSFSSAHPRDLRGRIERHLAGKRLSIIRIHRKTITWTPCLIPTKRSGPISLSRSQITYGRGARASLSCLQVRLEAQIEKNAHN